MAKEMSVPFLGSIPLDPNVLRCCEAGVSFLGAYPEAEHSAASKPFRDLLERIVKSTPSLTATFSARPDEDENSARAT